MNNIIDIYNPTTYPKKFNEIFKDCTEEKIDKIFKNHYFKCAHITCTVDINNYYKYGIMRPSKVVNGNLIINSLLKKLILEPLSNNFNYENNLKEYDKNLIKEYNEEKGKVAGWYGKYSSVCFTMDPRSKINVENSKYTSLIKNFGGELIGGVVLSEEKSKELGDKYNSYVIFFKLSYNDFKKYITNYSVIDFMREMYTKGNTSIRIEGSIYNDIPSTDFIEIIKIKK